MATKELKKKEPAETVSASVVPPRVTKPARTSKVLKAKKQGAPLKRDKRSAGAVKDEKVTLRIRVRAYESKILDNSIKQIIDTARRYDAEIVGPIPLPTEIKKYTVNRASFIYKNTREQFEVRVHKRLIDIINPNSKTVEALTNLSLPSGVEIDVKML